MLNQLDLTFQALADPARRAMLQRLSLGPAAVSQLAQPLTMSLPGVLQHLAVLEQAGLVRSAKTGRVRICELNGPALAMAQTWLEVLRAEWEARFYRLDEYLKTMEGDAHE